MNEYERVHGHAQSSDTNPDLRGAHGVIFHVETLGKGVAAILIAGILLAVLLAGMALMRTEATSERATLAERQGALAREDIRIMQITLANRGISTDEHSLEKSK